MKHLIDRITEQEPSVPLSLKEESTDDEALEDCWKLFNRIFEYSVVGVVVLIQSKDWLPRDYLIEKVRGLCY